MGLWGECILAVIGTGGPVKRSNINWLLWTTEHGHVHPCVSVFNFNTESTTSPMTRLPASDWPVMGIYPRFLNLIVVRIYPEDRGGTESTGCPVTVLAALAGLLKVVGASPEVGARPRRGSLGQKALSDWPLSI
eukprot:1122426-Prorocentrum_minimum.AAC.1